MTTPADTISVQRGDVDVLVAACTSYLPADISPEVTEAFRRLLQDWDNQRPAGPAAEQSADPVRYALVEQMGHRATYAAVRETTFCGAPMLEVTDLRTGSVHLAAPASLYEVSWLTEEEARRRAKPSIPAALPARSAWTAETVDDDDEDQDDEPEQLDTDIDTSPSTHVWGDDE